MKAVARRALVIPALFLTIGINGLAQDKPATEHGVFGGLAFSLSCHLAAAHGQGRHR